MPTAVTSPIVNGCGPPGSDVCTFNAIFAPILNPPLPSTTWPGSRKRSTNTSGRLRLSSTNACVSRDLTSAGSGPPSTSTTREFAKVSLGIADLLQRGHQQPRAGPQPHRVVDVVGLRDLPPQLGVAVGLVGEGLQRVARDQDVRVAGREGAGGGVLAALLARDLLQVDRARRPDRDAGGREQ